MNRPSVLVAALLVVLAAACQPRPVSVDVVNACNEQVRVRIWDRPTPGEGNQDDFTDADVPPASRVTVKEAVIDVGKAAWSAELLDGPGKGAALPIPRSSDRTVVIPARLCSR